MDLSQRVIVSLSWRCVVLFITKVTFFQPDLGRRHLIGSKTSARPVFLPSSFRPCPDFTLKICASHSLMLRGNYRVSLLPIITFGYNLWMPAKTNDFALQHTFKWTVNNLHRLESRTYDGGIGLLALSLLRLA
eukprot:scaffold8072_cov82-Skeletonema_menzelii.AAC.10